MSAQRATWFLAGMLRRWFCIWAMTAALATSGCHSIVHAFEDSKHTQDAIQSSLGIGSDVTFHVFSGPSGRKMVVKVTLRGKAAGAPEETKSKVVAIVNSTFREHVDQVDVSF